MGNSNKYVRYYDTVCVSCADASEGTCSKFGCPVVDALENCVALTRYGLPKPANLHHKRGKVGRRYTESMFAQDSLSPRVSVPDTKYEVGNSIRSFKSAQEAKKIILSRRKG